MKDFSRVPQVRYNRSKFDLSHGVKTTMSVGRLYPLKFVEVLPGDSFKSVMTAVCRCTSSFLKPIVDNLYMDVHHFFVPFRLLYDKTDGVYGNPNPNAWTENDFEEFPSFTEPQLISSGSVGDYLGLPVDTGVSGKRYIKKGASVMPFRAFARIYNDWFRSENVIDEMLVQTGELQSSETCNNNAWSPSNYTGQLPYVSKKKDYFTACLPNVQKGPAVPLPLGAAAPVVAKNTEVPSSYLTGLPTIIKKADGTSAGNVLLGVNDNTFVNAYVSDQSLGAYGLVPTNLWADLANATASDVSTLRTAFQLQKALEADARFGTRLNEYILSRFGVSTPDSRLQFTEYLGGGRIPIGIQQVSQTSAATENSPLGSFGANSQTVGKSRYSKGFVEPGYVFTVGCIKQLHTYQQGIHRTFFRHKRDDFYSPVYANISEQPVYKTQLFGYATGSDDTGDLNATPFGYNEAWAEYRYEPSMITGQMRSGISNSLDIWHLGDYYDSAPTLGQEFIEEGHYTETGGINRVLTVNTSAQDNFLVDIWFNVSAIRVMPVYSVPGLIDHH